MGEVGIEAYSNRLSVFCKMQIIEIPEEQLSDKMQASDIEKHRNDEGERILSHLTPGHAIVAFLYVKRVRKYCIRMTLAPKVF
ncbi:23S rRNA (pseudouridine(1915)-N(3))-methyltransferase RlmH [Brevibacillus reuszeri]|uniref:23S rRNA (pseudouridine(1915)-N(3))-methyltransferase RlmH n=1 Tax=Brevibacillus reuszeri TaxID=54915 RepID=UPI000CCBD71A